MTTHFRGGVTRLQIGTAACAVAAAAAFPAVASADTVTPAPLAPVTQILIDAPLSPVMGVADMAEQPAWLENGRTIIERFGALVFAVTGAIIAPFVAVAQTVITAIQRFFQIGPYSTGRG